MKIRTDFVTNSSSSSFVIAFRDMPKFDEETLNKYPFLNTFPKLIESVLMADGYGDTSAAHVIRTKEEYNHYFIERYGWTKGDTIEDIIKEEPGLKDLYDKVADYIKDGFAVAQKSVDYCDEGVEKIIRAFTKDNDNFILLEDD